MPTVLRFDGLRVVIYPNDHRPAHVHVIGAGCEATFVLNCPGGPPNLRENHGFSPALLNSIERSWPSNWQCFAGNGTIAMDEAEIERAGKRMRTLRDAGYVVSAHYDRRAGRVVLDLNSGVQLAVPAVKIEGLADASAADLAVIEITPAGLGLHWPRLDADIYVPALLQGVFGSKRWMAAQLGAAGGKVKSASKAAAARSNGRKGGRPRKAAA